MRRHSFARNAFLSIALLAAVPACAQSTYVDLEQRLSPEQVHATGLDTLSPAQLAELNRILRGEAERAPPLPATPRGASPPPEASSLLGFNDQPIRARVSGRVSEWEPGTVFVLDNGQQWKVLKGSLKLRKPLDAPEITVFPGVAGRWFLRVEEDMPAPRVYRID